MIKKILPIVSVLGISAFVVGTSIKPGTNEKKETLINHINSFEQEVGKFASATNTNLTKTALNKYIMSVEDGLNDSINMIDDLSETETNETENSTQNSLNKNDILNEIKTDVEDDNLETDENIIKETEKEIEEISTLYSLSNDIENSCDDFCVLKQNITDAIIETQNLIKKVQDNNLNLTTQQRIFITEQAQQLKSLSRKLSSVTTELSFNLSDIHQIMSTNADIDNLSLKYLVVLDNLVNGNEMLQSGLSSLNMINQMLNIERTNIPSNNQGRILYGFQQNNNAPIIKDYYIDENGKIVENNINESKLNQENNNSENTEQTQETNIDTYQNNKLTTNIDTYQNTNVPRNIDTFFNTALLDNEFMYGNGNYLNGINGPMNPYAQAYNYNNLNNNNTINGYNNNYNTQNIEENNQTQKEKKKFQLKKNIDTYKDENEPDIKTKLGNIKNSITGFFSNFKKADLSDKIENPISQYNPTSEN